MLYDTLVDDVGWLAPYMVWPLSIVELIAGITLLFTAWAAVPLLGICLGACVTDAPKRVREYQPIDWLDTIDDWLYLPETWMAMVLILLIVWELK